MNWNRYKVLIISGGLTLLVVGGCIFWIISSSSTRSELDAQVKTTLNRQKRLTSQEPYPSQENLNALLAEQAKVADRRDAIENAMSQGQVQVTPISRSRFGDYIKTTVPELSGQAAAARKGGENGVILRDAEFGLTEYLEGTLPNQNEINRLVVEIETMKHLASLLFTSGISELVRIEPVMVEEEEVEVVQPSRRRPSRNPRARQPVVVEEAPDFKVERKRMFEVITFNIEFKAYEDFFWETLNAILADPNQITVSSLSVTNGNTVLWPDYLKPVGQGTKRFTRSQRNANRNADILSLLQGNDEEAASQSTDNALPGLADRRQYDVGGDLLDVVMEVKIYRLKTEEPVREGEGV